LEVNFDLTEATQDLELDLPRFSGEGLAQLAAIFSN
jgi:hypothetical protein